MPASSSGGVVDGADCVYTDPDGVFPRAEPHLRALFPLRKLQFSVVSNATTLVPSLSVRLRPAAPDSVPSVREGLASSGDAHLQTLLEDASIDEGAHLFPKPFRSTEFQHAHVFRP